MWKYQPLKDFLKNSINKTEILTFQELENILGFDLPESAYEQPSWWANGKANPLVQQKAWMYAGWGVDNGTEAICTHEVIFCKITKPYIPIDHIYHIFAYFNCRFSCDENKLKKVYQETLNQYDAPNLKEIGFAQEFVELAEAKTKELNDMYERALKYAKPAATVDILIKRRGGTING